MRFLFLDFFVILGAFWGAFGDKFGFFLVAEFGFNFGRIFRVARRATRWVFRLKNA